MDEQRRLRDGHQLAILEGDTRPQSPGAPAHERAHVALVAQCVGVAVERHPPVDQLAGDTPGGEARAVADLAQNRARSPPARRDPRHGRAHRRGDHPEDARDAALREQRVMRCFAKLDLHDRAQAVVLAYESGIVQPGEGAEG